MAVLPKCSDFKLERLKKQMNAYFKSLGLRTTVEAPRMITDFLDVDLNLNDISYRKLNSNIMYINKNSSHPKNIIKQIPNIINDRLNKISTTDENFLKVKSDYETIMEKGGYKEKLHYKNSEQNTLQNVKEKEI